MKLSKKSQVTVFMLFGIVILVVVGFILYLRIMFGEVDEGEMRKLEEESILLKSSVGDCVKATASYAIYLMGMQGRIYLDDSYATLPNIKIAYAYNGKDTLISLPEMEEQISTYMDENLHYCTETIFFDFEKKGIKIKAKHPKTKTDITAEDAVVKVSYPIIAGIGRARKDMKDFRENIPIRLKHLHDIAQTIANQKAKNPGYINMTYLNSLDINSTILPYVDGTDVLLLKDPRSAIRNKPYVFSFAMK